ncbi:MAG: anti-sigma factor antagonist [Clostridiales bacterium]|nr:anti-sigma factor antagonist [Clostridiales bacterium]
MVFIQISISQKILIVKLENDLDHHVANEIKDEIDRQIMTSKTESIIFDFEKVKFMDSSGIGLISGRISVLDAQKESNNIIKNKNISSSNDIAIINLDKRLTTMMRISGLDKIVNFFDDLESAMSALRKNKHSD